MVNEGNGDKAKPQNVRVTVGRSPAYPYIPLEKALDRVEQIKAAGAHRQAMSPETFFQLWKFGALSSGARQTLAALNNFGLVDYLGRGDDKKVRLSELALRIVLDKQERSAERDAAIREAALTPSIHAELYEKYGPFLPANVVVQTFLERDKQYNESAAKALIQEYRETLSFSGLDKPDSMSASEEHREPEADPRYFPDPAQQRDAMREMLDQRGAAPRGAPGPSAPPGTFYGGGVAAPAEDVMRGKLGGDTSFKLYVEGPFDKAQINTLIRLLVAQREALEPDEPERDAPDDA